MCGILGFCGRAGRFDEARVRAALAAMRHRGPDGEGAWVARDGRAALGHVRLAIIDPGGADQPLRSEDGRTLLCANGEFYDFERIREELQQRGHRFQTKCDSEIALHLWEESGIQSLPQLRGEFAFVVWDDRDEVLYAVRDRFGIKPLYWAETPDGVLVASEIKALFAAGVRPAWNPEGLVRALHFVPQPTQSIYANVGVVPPGHALVVRGGTARLQRYWDLDYPRRSPLGQVRPESLIEQVRAEVQEAVRLRLRADVPIGCYLSGGVDSASVLGLAARAQTKPVAAFTIAFDHPDFDETEGAASMARHVGADLHLVRVRAPDYADAFEPSVLAAEMPQINGHGPARWLLSRAVRDAGYKAVLGGEGADEIFGGYEFTQSALSSEQEPLLRRAMSALRGDGSALRDVSGTLAALTAVLPFPSRLRRVLVSRLELIRGLFDADLLRQHQPRDMVFDLLLSLPLRKLWRRAPHQLLLYGWMKSHFCGYVLAGERMDMAHAVEVRLPFLDHVLFERFRGLSAAQLAPNGANKHLLRSAMSDVVCDEVLHAPKHPFFAPPTALVRGSPLTEVIGDLLCSEDFRQLRIFDHAKVAALLTTTRHDRAIVDPVLYALGSLAALQRNFRPIWP